MGWFLAFRYVKTFCYWDYLFRSSTHRKACFLYCRWYDSWYVSEKIINTFAERGFHTIGTLKTNRILYPFGIKKKLNEFAVLLSVTHSDFHLVTVKNQLCWKCRSSFKLSRKSIWEPESIAGFSQHRRVLINGWDSVLLRMPMADWNIFPPV